MRIKVDLELFAAILWAKWNARNQWLFKGKRENPQIVVAKAKAVMEAYKRVQPSTVVSHGNQQRVAQQAWNPPLEGFVKVNTDAATNSEKNLAGLRAVIRDETGFTGSTYMMALEMSATDATGVYYNPGPALEFEGP
ncbi:hypothetical protein WN943_029447 [Citrus x changshan-huyou]